METNIKSTQREKISLRFRSSGIRTLPVVDLLADPVPDLLHPHVDAGRVVRGAVEAAGDDADDDGPPGRALARLDPEGRARIAGAGVLAPDELVVRAVGPGGGGGERGEAERVGLALLPLLLGEREVLLLTSLEKN